jgi:hypothetical protein
VETLGLTVDLGVAGHLVRPEHHLGDSGYQANHRLWASIRTGRSRELAKAFVLDLPHLLAHQVSREAASSHTTPGWRKSAMARRRWRSNLERWEVALVKAMLARGGYNDQDILAYNWVRLADSLETTLALMDEGGVDFKRPA